MEATLSRIVLETRQSRMAGLPAPGRGTPIDFGMELGREGISVENIVIEPMKLPFMD